MKKILLGMSGGVDSTVAAILLMKKGWHVIGATLDLLPQKNSIGEKAKKIAEDLGIEHHILDFKDKFRECVIDDFLCAYANGKTPSPCIECNRHIKFGAMMDFAKENGIDYIATGHYARVEFDKKLERYLLKKSSCLQKDQSYMLYTLSQKQLSSVVFPLESLSKDEVRQIALENNLSVAKEKDSQEICFVPDDDHIKFLSENMKEPMQEGYFTDTKGNILGTHQGIHRYTIGQRKGLGIAFGKPMFVVSIDKGQNRVILGEAGEEYSDSLVAERVNFIPFDTLKEPVKADCKIRYGTKSYSATIYPEGEKRVRLVFDTPARAVTPGQSVVFYDGDTILGGGIIS